MNVLYNIAGESLSIGLVMASGVPEMIEDKFDNPVLSALVTGGSIALADDIYNYVSGVAPTTLIQNMQYKAFANTALYNAIAFTGAHTTGVDKMLGDAVSKFSPLPPAINTPVALGTMMVGANALRNVLALQQNQLSQYIVQPLLIAGIQA